MSPRSEYDAIAIGSGIGALAFASIMAKLRKWRVLVLERHFKIGGFTHTFTRPGGWSWDVESDPRGDSRGRRRAAVQPRSHRHSSRGGRAVGVEVNVQQGQTRGSCGISSAGYRIRRRGVEHIYAPAAGRSSSVPLTN